MGVPDVLTHTPEALTFMDEIVARFHTMNVHIPLNATKNNLEQFNQSEEEHDYDRKDNDTLRLRRQRL